MNSTILKHLVWGIILAFLIMVAYQAWLNLGVTLPREAQPDDPGSFGDQFGAVNALFSGLGLAFISFTLLLQISELGITRKIMMDQKKEMEDSSRAQERTAKLNALAIQMQNYTREADHIQKKVNEKDIVHAKHYRLFDYIKNINRKEIYQSRLRQYSGFDYQGYEMSSFCTGTNLLDHGDVKYEMKDDADHLLNRILESSEHELKELREKLDELKYQIMTIDAEVQGVLLEIEHSEMAFEYISNA